MDQNDLGKVMLDTNVVESETRMFGSYEGVYLKYNDLVKNKSFNQRIYMLCPEHCRILTIHIGDDVSKEDTYKFVEGLVITAKEEMIETADMEKWSDLIDSEEIIEEAVTNANIPIYQVGDTFGLGYSTGEDEDGNDISSDGIMVCVDEVQIADDLQLLKEEYIPKEWKTAVDQNGNLVQNHLSYAKAGDGYDYYVGDSVARTTEMGYYDVKETYDNASNYISSLKPGESIQIHMAWIVNETDLQNLYLDLSGFGTPFEIHENVVNTGLVYIGR